jgi:DNA-binding NarL/FixJ family response regulator
VNSIKARTVSLEVLVSDTDHITVRLLTSDLQRQEQFAVSGCLANLSQLLSSISARRPCVLLLGLSAHDCVADTLSLLRQVHEEFPWLRTIILSEETGRDLVLEVFRAGAKGFFDRSIYDPVLLCRCIQCVAEGQIWAKSEQLGFVLEAFASTPRIQVTKGVQSLTPREREVARLVSDGMCNREVAQRLELSIHTVKNYLFSIFDKIGVSNRAELILYLLASNAPPRKPATGTTGGRSRQDLSHESHATSASRHASIVAKRAS